MATAFFRKNYLLLILGLASIAGLYLLSLYSYIIYHSIIELFSIIIAIGIFVVAWNSRKYLDNHFLLFVGLSYFFVAILDLLHTLAYSGSGVFIGFIESDLATQLWIAARYMQSVSLLLALLFITRRLNLKIQFVAYSIVAILLLLSIFYWEVFPACFIEGSGLTQFKIISEYIISFILAAAVVLLFFYRSEFNPKIFSLIIASLALTIVSELMFTLYDDVYGLFNQLGHFLKLVSFFLIYKAVIETGFSQPLDLLFFKLKQGEKEIKDNEKKFRSLFLSMNEAVCLQELLYDANGQVIDYKIVDVNPSFVFITGWPREQVVGRKASETYGTDIPYLDAYLKVIKTGDPVRFETYFPALDKYLSLSAFSPAKGKIATVFSDITQRKKAELEIESLSRFTLENPNPVMRIDKKNSIIYANDPAQQILANMGDKQKTEFIKVLQKSAESYNREEGSAVTEITLGKLIYEFTIVPVKESNYLNIYGTDITIRKNAEKLQKKIARERALSQERNKLARELHDTVTQTLFSANLIAGTIPKLWEKDPNAVAKRLEEIKLLYQAALKEMRILLYELKPSALKDENLINLLNQLVKSIESKSKIPVTLSVEGEYKYPSKIEFGFYRIAQEALNNIIKHSSATQAYIIIKSNPQNLELTIQDNGRGFDPETVPSTNLGLNIMKERARIMGASINIKSVPDEGTRIHVVFSKAVK